MKNKKINLGIHYQYPIHTMSGLKLASFYEEFKRNRKKIKKNFFILDLPITK